MIQKLSIISFFPISLLLLVSCNEPKSIDKNRDPNGTSELQLTMRDMYDHYESIKKDLAAGKTIDEVKAFRHILTDTPTEEGKNETGVYKAMSQTYFNAVQLMNKQKDQQAFELVVDACMSCHQQVCPGPMVKIKKLYAGG